MHQSQWEFRCALCGVSHRRDEAGYCTACGGPVLAEVVQRSDEPLEEPGSGIWRYARHLPIREDEAWIGLGEGTVAVVRADDLACRIGVREVWLALDYLGPTGSFKDRAAAAGVAHAVEHGAAGIVCASSGNAATATAAYAARARLPAVVVVPEDTPPGKLAATQALGAIVLRTPGDYSNSFALGCELCTRLGFTNVATTFVNPFAVAALCTVAFELARQLGPQPIDRVIVPTGAGPLVRGVAEGFRYVADRDRTCRVPHVDAVQMTGCAPIVRAFDNDEKEVRPWGQVTTRVSGLNDPLRGYPHDGTATLAEVRRTGGTAVCVDDDQTFNAQAEIADNGLLVEPAAATSVAALAEIATRVRPRPDARIVCLLTGHGLKTLNIDRATIDSAVVVRNVDAATEALSGHL